jgi:hypothetical protein
LTPRFALLFVVLYTLMVFGEWFQYFHGFDVSLWTFSNWVMLVFVLLAEAAAVAIITLTIDRALPTVGNRIPAKNAKQSRRGSQKYSSR